MSSVPNESQRAMVGARIKPLFEEEARQRQRVHGHTAPGRTLVANLPRVLPGQPHKARDDAAAAAHVSARSVELRCCCGWRWRTSAATDPDGALCPVCGKREVVGVTVGVKGSASTGYRVLESD